MSVGLEEAPAFRDRHLVERRYVGNNLLSSKPVARLGIEFSITGVSVQQSQNAQNRNFLAEVELEGVVLFSTSDQHRTAPLRRLEFHIHDPSAVSSEPLGTPELSEGDTLLLTLLKANLFEPTPEQWRQWAGARVRMEASNDRDIWPAFFAGNVEAHGQGEPGDRVGEALLTQFQAWSRKRAEAMPSTVELVSGAMRLTSEQRAAGRLPLLSRNQGNEVRTLGERIGVPFDHLYLLPVRNPYGFPLPINTVVLALPEAADSYAVNFDSGSAPGDDYLRSRLHFELANPQVIDFNRRSALLLDAKPESAQLLAGESGEEVARAEFQGRQREKPPAVAFPPEGYMAVLHARMGVGDAVETLFSALDTRQDAFTRRQRAEELVARAREFVPEGEGFWVGGEVTYGEYDFGAQRFPVASLTLDDFARSHGRTVSLRPAERNQFDVTLPPEEARQWQRNNASHPRYALRARVVAETAQSNALELRALEIELLEHGDTLAVRDPERVLYHITLSQPESTSTAETPQSATETQPNSGAAGEQADVRDEPLAILGLTLGSLLDEAIELLSEKVTEAVVFRTERTERSAAQGGNLWDPFNEAVMIRSGDGREAVMVYSESPTKAERVTALTRWVDLGASGPPLSSVESLLTKHYGEPDTRSDRETAVLLAWQAEPGKVNFQCESSLTLLTRQQWRLDELPWPGLDGPFQAPRSLASQPSDAARVIAEEGAFPFKVNGFIGSSPLALCPETLFALIVAGPDGRALRILTGLADPLALAETVEANRTSMMRGAANESTAEIDLKF